MTLRIEHIAIVGCGFTGTSALHQIVERELCHRITVFELSGDFGPGYAYNPEENEHYLLNNTTDSLYLDPDKKCAFLNWLEAKQLPNINLSPKGNVPRKLYGLFLRESVDAAARKARQRGIKVEFVTHEITGIHERDGVVELRWCNTDTSADRVIMATGRCPEIEYLKPTSTCGSARYVNSHILNEEIDAIGSDETILVLGTSLSAYDVINRLFAPETGCSFIRAANGELVYQRGSNSRNVILASRSGRLKKFQSLRPAEVSTNEFDDVAARFTVAGSKISLEVIGQAIWSDTGAAIDSLDLNDVATPYRHCKDTASVNEKAGELLSQDLILARSKESQNRIVDFFSQERIRIWDLFARRALTPESEQAYRRMYESATLSFAAPCPISTGERLLALHRAGVLEVITGVGYPGLTADGSLFETEHQYGSVSASTMINATGTVDRHLFSHRQPAWIQDLVHQGTLRPYILGDRQMPGADIDLNTYRPPGTKAIYFANMLLWGPGFFTSSASTMATIVSQILDQIGSELES